MIIGIDASRANMATRTGTEWYAFSLIINWGKNNSFAQNKVRLYIREQLQQDFPQLPENWEVKILKWKPKFLWTQIRLSIELLFHPVDALFVPAHTIPFIHPKKTFTTLHDVGFERTRYAYNPKAIARSSHYLLKGALSILVRIVTLGKYSANEYDYHRFSARFAVTHATTLFTVSEFSKKEISSLYPKHPPIIVAYNGIDPEAYRYPYPKKQAITRLSAYSISYPFIISIGRIERKKQSLELLRAFVFAKKKYNIPQHLIFAGGKGYGAQEIIDLIALEKLEYCVHLLGWIPQEDLPPLLASADVFAILSIYEGFGVPLIQSCAVGTPILASDLEVFHEIAGDIPRYANASHIEQTARQLFELCTMSLKQRESFAKKSSSVCEKFSWDASAQIIEKEILRQLLA